MMLSKIISSVFNFVSGRNNKRKLEKAEDEVLTPSMKRAKTEAEPDSTSSWAVMGDTFAHNSRTKKFDDLYDCRPITSQQQFRINSAMNSDGTLDSERTLPKFNGGPVKEVFVSSCSSGDLSCTSLQRPVYVDSSTNFNIGAMGIDQVSRTVGKHRRVILQQRHDLMARECVDLEGKEEYQRLISEHTANKYECQETIACCVPRESTKNKSCQLDGKLSFQLGSAKCGADRLKQRIDASSSILTRCVISSDSFRQVIYKPGHISGAASSQNSLSPDISLTTQRRNLEYVWSTRNVTKLDGVDLKDAISLKVNEPLNQEGKENLSLTSDHVAASVSAGLVDEKLKNNSLQSSIVRSPVSCEWQNSLQQSKYAQPDFLTEISRNERSEEILRKLKESETEVQLFKEKRYEQEEKLTKMVRRVLRLSRKTAVPFEKSYYEISSEDEEEDKDDVDEMVGFAELSEDQEAAVDRMLSSSAPDQIVVEGFKLQLTRRDILTLSGLNWLNDEVINFYMNLLMERGSQDGNPRVYSFSTFFYPKLMSGGHSSVKRWTKQVDLFKYDFLLIPVHLGVHWCLAVVDFQQKQICYYDSMGSQNDKCLSALQKYLEVESLEKRKTEFNFNGWKLLNLKDIPQQMNGSDCGMFACKFAEFVTRNAPITFNQSHMPYFRRRMVYEIITKKLM